MRIITSFHEGMQGTVLSCMMNLPRTHFQAGTDWNKGAYLPTLFWHLLAAVIHLQPVWWRSMTSMHKVMGACSNVPLCEARQGCAKCSSGRCFFADAAALTAYTKEALQQLTSCFSHACREFGLTISLKKTSDICQDFSSTSSSVIGKLHLPVVQHCTQFLPGW